jgi:hypothetical protein
MARPGKGNRAVALNTPTFVQGSDDGDIFHSIVPAFPIRKCRRSLD